MATCMSVNIEYWALVLTNILLLLTLLTNTEYIAQTALCMSVNIEYIAVVLTNILLLPTLLTNTEYIAQMALCMSGSIDQPTDECRSWEPLPHPANHSHTGCNLSRLIILFSPHICSICPPTMSCHICSFFIYVWYHIFFSFPNCLTFSLAT